MFEELTIQIFDWIDLMPPAGLYLVITLIAYIENIVPPIPGDLAVAFAGYLAASGSISFFIIYSSTTIASVIGFMSLYFVGKYFGFQIDNQPGRVRILRFIKFSHYARVKDWMQQWGQGLVMANRFIPGMRSVISVVAGVSHTHAWRTMLSSFVSSALWNLILLAAGWTLYESWRKIELYLSVYAKTILGILTVLIVIIAGYKYWNKHAKSGRENNGNGK